MKETRRFLTTAEMIQARHSGWSGVKCDTCKRVTTKAQLLYSMRVYGKPLCRSCQSLESYCRKYPEIIILVKPKLCLIVDN